MAMQFPEYWNIGIFGYSTTHLFPTRTLRNIRRTDFACKALVGKRLRYGIAWHRETLHGNVTAHRFHSIGASHRIGINLNSWNFPIRRSGIIPLEKVAPRKQDTKPRER